MLPQLLHKTIAGLATTGLLLIAFNPIQQVQAQTQNPFLTTPYYGYKGINSFFDHDYPNYNADNLFIRYDGGTWTNTTYCTIGVNCYDGHNGADFALTYDDVLAADGGLVYTAGWNYPNCRSGPMCGYGLRIEIQHDNGYTTLYGHLSAAMTNGRRVPAGQVIGTSGNTGNSTGPHLHFGIRDANNRYTDPFGWQGTGTDPLQTYNGLTSWCMWNDGEWANVCGGISHPLTQPADGPTQIIDDLNYNGFTKGCSAIYPCPYWNEANIGYNNHMWWTYVNGDVLDYHAKWTPNLLLPGLYEVYVYTPCINATTWQALYNIATTDGYWSAYVDQYGLCDQWVTIGTYPFLAGYRPDHNVAVYDNTGNEGQHCSGTCQLGIDALKFIRRGSSTYLPMVVRQ